MSATSMLRSLDDVGRDARRGGYTRPVFSGPELQLREWFVAEARRLGLDVETDPNGLIWAWWDVPGGRREDAVATGSHLDSVPGGGAFDGPLGVVSALCAVEQLQAAGHRPDRPLVVIVFPEEEGSRFGVACLGSRLLTGAIAPEVALALKDDTGQSLAETVRRQGLDPTAMGPDPSALARLGVFVELHVEQGRGLVDLGQPVAVGSSILGHGRWRLRFEGEGNHAGTTVMRGRSDPMVPAAGAILATESEAARVPGARATVGKLVAVPGGANVIASTVDLWLDVRHQDDETVQGLAEKIGSRARTLAGRSGCRSTLTCESYSATAHFDTGLTGRLREVLPSAPLLDTGAGHDAGVLAAHVPSAMVFVRNPTGISHSPDEHVEDGDVDEGARTLARVLGQLTTT